MNLFPFIYCIIIIVISFSTEVVRAMNYVINKGWVLYWGRLNFTFSSIFLPLPPWQRIFVCVIKIKLQISHCPSSSLFIIVGSSKWSTTEIMEAYTNCREFNCVTPIMEQSEYHMFCRERAELYLPEMYNKIGVGLMVWGPLGMYLTENTERLFFSKGSLRSKTQNSSWTEDELAKEVRISLTPFHHLHPWTFCFLSLPFHINLGSCWGGKKAFRKNSRFEFVGRETGMQFNAIVSRMVVETRACSMLAYRCENNGTIDTKSPSFTSEYFCPFLIWNSSGKFYTWLSGNFSFEARIFPLR